MALINLICKFDTLLNVIALLGFLGFSFGNIAYIKIKKGLKEAGFPYYAINSIVFVVVILILLLNIFNVC